MDWVILLLLVPALVVPVVLLWGFAGCGTQLIIDDEEIPIPGVMGLTATATGDHEITLEWNNEPSKTSRFDVFRAPQGVPIDPTTPIASFAFTLGLKGFTNQDAALGEIDTFVYRMAAFNAMGHKLATSNDVTVTSLPLAPSEVKAEPKDATSIQVTWKNNSLKADRMVINDDPLPAGPHLATEVAAVPELFTSQPLTEGSQHKYQLAALFRGTLNGIPNQEVKSVLTPAVTVIASTFKAAISVGLATDQANVQGYCFVTRFPAIGTQAKIWTKIRITLRGSTTGPLTINKLTISQPADQYPPDPLLPATARERWDSASAGLGNPSGIRVIETGVGPNGAPVPFGTAVILPANSPRVFVEDYTWDESKDLIIAFDVNPTPGQGNTRYGPLTPTPPPKSYFKAPQPPALAPVAQAGTQDRSSDFQPSQAHILVEKIEVA